MLQSNININILVRVILITVSCLALAFGWVYFNDPIININIAAAIIAQVYFLIKKINKTNDDLALFFDSIKYEDTGLKVFQKIKLEKYHKLYTKLDELANQIAHDKEQYAKQTHYLQTITEHTGAGLISIDPKGTILLCNKAAKNILGLKSITNIYDLDQLSEDFAATLTIMQPGEQKVIKLHKKTDNRIMNILLIATEFKSGRTTEKLISISDIRNELDEKELEAWQKMIQILTHEMMNSIGPLTSTIATLKFIISEEGRVKGISELSDEMIADIYSGLRIIDQRTLGLQGFVKGFRSLTKLPQPELIVIQVKDLFISIKELLSKELMSESIVLEVILNKDDATIFADRKLIEQVLINLIKNSIDALHGISTPKILMAFEVDKSNQPQIIVADNGIGITPEQIDEIFVPFYTTKKEGSGIGLSLSRQIMRLHGGSLTVKSNPGVETSFYLKF